MRAKYETIDLLFEQYSRVAIQKSFFMTQFLRIMRINLAGGADESKSSRITGG